MAHATVSQGMAAASTQQVGSRELEAQAPWEGQHDAFKAPLLTWCKVMQQIRNWELVGFWAPPWKSPWSEIQRRDLDKQSLVLNHKKWSCPELAATDLFYCEETKPLVTADWGWNKTLEGEQEQTEMSSDIFSDVSEPLKDTNKTNPGCICFPRTYRQFKSSY